MYHKTQHFIHRQNIDEPRDEQRYNNTYLAASGEEKMSKYIDKLNMIKSAVHSQFESLRTSITNTEAHIVDEISKQQATALSVDSDHFMEDSLSHFEALLAECSSLLSQTTSAVPITLHLHATHVRITCIDVINTKTLRIHFEIKDYNYKSQISLHKCHVMYQYQSRWIAAKIHSLSSTNNHLIVFLNHHDCDKDFYINVKMRFGDNHGSDPYSKAYTVSIPKCDRRHVRNIFYLSQNLRKNPAGLYIANKYSNSSEACHVFELQSDSPHVLTIRKEDKWRIKYAGVCFAKDIVLPQQIAHKLYTNNTINSKSTDCLFKCGGMCSGARGSTYCSCIVLHNVDDSTFCNPSSSSTRSDPCLSAKSKCFAINCDLPSFPQQTDCNDITYSERNGLLSVGGWEFHYNSDAFYRLSFHSEAYFDASDEWRWDKMPKMKAKRSWPTIVMLERYNQLMAIGGRGPINSVEIFDFEANEWKNASDIMYARSSASVCYDIKKNKVYIGGGNGDNINVSKTVECYDAHKNRWFQDIPETKKLHCSRPVMWLSDNEYLLYIASVESNSMEYIDLRMNNKGWNVVYGNEDNRLWQRVFGTDFVKNDNCRLLL